MEILEELLAERELRKIIALYPHYADDRRAQDFANLFAADGEIVVGQTVAAGRDAIATWLDATLQGPAMRHMMLNSISRSCPRHRRAAASIWCCCCTRMGNGWSGRPRAMTIFTSKPPKDGNSHGAA